MNERIKALADQAAKYAATAALPTGKSGDDLFVEKFAELIIQDCVACCEVVAQAAKEKDEQLGPFTYFEGREGAARLCKSTIKRHFEEAK